MGLALTVAFFYSIRDLFNIYLHRILVALRESSGMLPFDPLARPPRHVCLVIARRSRAADIEKAVKTLQAAGCEKITVSHDGSLVLSVDGYSETIICDMGRSDIVSRVNQGAFNHQEVSYPDVVLILSRDRDRTLFSTSALKLEKCVDASVIYYSELIPVYSLNPSDVFLAVSMFQSKSQRFGR